jgi:hypothetical protein
MNYRQGIFFKTSNHNIRKFAKGEAVEGVRFLADLNGSVPHGRGQAPFNSEPDRTSGENEAKSLTPFAAGTCWNPLGLVPHKISGKTVWKRKNPQLNSRDGKVRGAWVRPGSCWAPE